MDENNDKDCHHRVSGIYQPCHPEKTVLYQIFQDYLETWIIQTRENGERFPWQWAILGQLLYLVLFSYSFFLEEMTGLTVTIGLIITLAVLMKLTARIN